jgi:hypothetical protein
VPKVVTTPRILFFGPARSGKSELLKLFLKAMNAAPGAETQGIPVVGPDTKVQRELTPYRVLVTNPSAGPLGGQYELCDCDGEAANALLNNSDGILRARAKSILAEAVRSADALVLVVDAGATPDEIEANFRQFQQFLEILQADRSFQREVGGWPVLLTLTKCDTLYQPGDTASTWLDHIEKRKAEVEETFHEFFGDEPNDLGFHSFGSLSLQVHATATQAPEGPAFDVYTDALGAFGVLDLVGQCCVAAQEQEARVVRSRKSLRYTVLGVGGFVTMLMIAILLFVTAGATSATDALAERVRFYQTNESPVAVRLAEKRYARTLKDLKAFQANENFANLPTELQDYVTGRVQEAEEYKAYRAKFQPPRLGAAEMRDRDQVEALRMALATELQPPATYRESWKETEAVQLAFKWRTDLDILLSGEGQLHEWYRGLIRRANEAMLTSTPPDALWSQQVEALFSESRTPLFDPNAEIATSTTVPVPRGKKLTYASIYRYERCELAKRDWDDTERRLMGLKKLLDALSLTKPNGTLEIPEPGPMTSAVIATELLRRLPAKTASLVFPEWMEAAYPEAVSQVVVVRLRLLRSTAIRHMQKQLDDSCDRVSRDSLRGYLASPVNQNSFAAWDDLVIFYDDLIFRKPQTSGPLKQLMAFINTDKFTLNLSRLVVTWPDDLLEQKATPTGMFVVIVQGKDYPYKLTGEAVRERPLTTARFAPDGHTGQFTLLPTDDVSATVTLRSGGEDYRLKWTTTRQDFRFAALENSPTIEKLSTPGARVVLGVTLTVPQPSSWHPLPDLLRDGRLR